MNPRRFRNAAVLKAEENLGRFIAGARRSNPFGVEDWDGLVWIVRRKSRASRRGTEALRFWRHPHVAQPPERFVEPFAGFVRAVVCRREETAARGIATSRHEDTIRACRYLYEILLPRTRGTGGGGSVEVCPARLSRGDFDSAQSAAKAREKAGSANNVSGALQAIADALDRNGLVPVPLQWKASRSWAPKHDRVGEAADERRRSKMPSDRLLDALADISCRTDLEDRDLLRQRAGELLVCGGFRINELLTLPRDTWHSERMVDERGVQVHDRFGKPVERYGLRYWPEKGGAKETQVKWLPTVMAAVARRAVHDILRMTAPHAEAARFMAEHPGRTRLGFPWDDMPPDRLLTMSEAAELLGLKNQVSMFHFTRAYGVPVTTAATRHRRAQAAVCKGDLETVLLRQSGLSRVILPGGEGRIQLHQCLFVVPAKFFHPKNGDLRGTARLVNDGQMYAYLCGNTGTKSIFERLGLINEDGTPLRMNSHQFRHWLNTLAQEGGLSEVEVARWMGRTSIGQNAAYDHVPPAELARRVRDKLRAGQAAGPVADHVRRIKDPVRREEFIRSNVPAIHTTDLGGCGHDWSATPCDAHGDCAGCDKLWITKGDAGQCVSAQALEREAKLSVEQARAEQAGGTWGADNWLAHQERTLARARAMLAVHCDASIPDGTIVRMRRDGSVEADTGTEADDAEAA